MHTEFQWEKPGDKDLTRRSRWR